MYKPQHFNVIKRVTYVNATLNALLALIKIFIGLIGQSQALFADGLHSLSDLISDAFVFFAAKAADKSPDKEHPYGHQRIETVAAIVIAFFLVTVAALIAYGTLHRIFAHLPSQHPSYWVVLVATLSIIINEFLYRYTLKRGESIHSNLLKTNAWHNRTDALVSLIVLVGVIGTYFGFTHLDAIAALVIAVLILKTAAQMIWKSVLELIDTAVDEDTLAHIREVISQVPGVVEIHQLRTRYLGGNVFVDVHVIVSPHISVSEGHHVSDEVYFNLLEHIKEIADVTVHVDPEDDEKNMACLSLPNRTVLTNILASCWHNLPAYHSMTLHYLNGHIEIDLYFKEDVPATAYETTIQATLPGTRVRSFKACL